MRYHPCNVGASRIVIFVIITVDLWLLLPSLTIVQFADFLAIQLPSQRFRHMSSKNILVTGATGQQGRALIAALCPKQDAEAKFHVLALTRSSTGPIAKQLALEKHVTIVEGDMMSVESIRKVFEDAKENGGVWGVYCVVAFPGLGAKADGEEQQGKASRWVFQSMQLPLTETFRQ